MGWQKRGTSTYTPPANAPRRHRNDVVPHPTTGALVFGSVPAIAYPNISLPAGDIVLRYGQQRADHVGFGFMHIWQQHFAHIEDHDTALAAVAAEVATIVTTGTPIFYEAGSRITMFKRPEGVVIAELKETGDGTQFYSIVACYPGTKANGSRVGAVA